MNYDEAIELIKHNELPSDFDQWKLSNEIGWTVAHEASKYGHLPTDFDQ